jgi:hypothetical protein
MTCYRDIFTLLRYESSDFLFFYPASDDDICNVSETVFYLHLLVVPTELEPIDKVSPCFK